MARSGPDVFVKRNNKLEAFLKRNLEEEVFERIRTHEACIVCSAKEDKAFKYVIISDEWIYLTENPPKKVTPCVHLADVVNIELVNEFPDFLQGEERENSQHIAIHFLTNEPPKGRRRRNSSRRSARSTLTASLTNSGLVLGKDERRKSFDDRLSLSTSRTLLSTSRSWRESSLSPVRSISYPGKGSDTQRTLEATTPRQRSKSLYVDSSMKFSTNNNSVKKSKGKKSEDENNVVQNGRKTSRKVSKDSQGSLDESKNKENDIFNETSKSKKSKNKRKESKSDTSSLEVPAITVDNWDADELRLPLEELEDDEDESVFTFRSDMTDDGIWEDEEWRKDTLHLYIVNYSSPLLILTRFAWSNYLIRATLELDEEYFRKTNRIKRSPGNGVYEKMNQLYNELKGEILDSNNSMETLFELMLELKTAAERNFTLRKLFWKTPEMFAFIVKQLKTYLPDPPKGKKTSPAERVDQLEYVMLLADALCVMLRETEVIPSRVHCIRVSGAKVFLALLTALTCTPSSPNQSSSATTNELTNVITQLLYELLLVAHQASMEDDQSSFLNIHNMMAIMSDLPSTEELVGRCLHQAVDLLSPSHRHRLPASSSVLLYHQFTFLNRLLEYSPKAIDFIRNNFYEEFKYYIQAPIIEAKLPKIYPISPYVVKQIQNMMKVVLQKEVNLGLEPYYGSQLPIYMLCDE